jgi:ATP-dependent RNA helicase DeaD
VSFAYKLPTKLNCTRKYEKGINVVAVYGGASITEQAREIKRGAQIIVATPGRMQDMINRGLVNITQINYCILDEADEMLNMGFYEDIVNILSTLQTKKALGYSRQPCLQK